ncbi:hypothetical protein [Sphingomonas sp.]|uniref:hypothetical protein n=1 Tax=Sphingomonas sp. TaxID=28214 RepID=UPI0038A6020C
MKLSLIVARLVPAAAALAAASTVAQPSNPYGGGTRLEKQPEAISWPVDKSRPVLADFGQCAAKRAPELARSMVLSATTIDLEPKYRKLFDPDCFGKALMRAGLMGAVQLEMSQWRGRTIIASALVNQDLATFDASEIKLAAPIARLTISANMLAATGAKEREELANEQRNIALETFSDCVIRANPVGSQVLLRSKINSDDEMQAIHALIPAMSGCVDRGNQFKLDRETVRGALAFNFYRLAYASRTGAAH